MTRFEGIETLDPAYLHQLPLPQHQQLHSLNTLDKLLYLSCDHPIFADVSLYAFVEYFYERGGKCVLIDEIHEAKNFQETESVIGQHTEGQAKYIVRNIQKPVVCLCE
jgi:hypothetical protein